jgi:vacuolar protein 8
MIHRIHAKLTRPVAIEQAGAIAPLVAMLSSYSTYSQRTRAPAEALANLAFNDDNRVAIARAGAIAPLVALLSGGGTDEVMGAVARALGNLSCNNANNKAAITRAGAIAPLVALLLSAGGTNIAYAAAAKALANLGVGHRCTHHRRASKRERD